MGDIADAMLDGTLCTTCGVFIGEPVGCPKYCPGCEPPGYKLTGEIGRRMGELDDAVRRQSKNP